MGEIMIDLLTNFKSLAIFPIIHDITIRYCWRVLEDFQSLLWVPWCLGRNNRFNDRLPLTMYSHHLAPTMETLRVAVSLSCPGIIGMVYLREDVNFSSSFEQSSWISSHTSKSSSSRHCFIASISKSHKVDTTAHSNPNSKPNCLS